MSAGMDKGEERFEVDSLSGHKEVLGQFAAKQVSDITIGHGLAQAPRLDIQKRLDEFAIGHGPAQVPRPEQQIRLDEVAKAEELDG